MLFMKTFSPRLPTARERVSKQPTPLGGGARNSIGSLLEALLHLLPRELFGGLLLLLLLLMMTRNMDVAITIAFIVVVVIDSLTY